MSDADEELIIPLDILQGIFEFIFRESVESGRIEIGDKTPEQIFSDFNKDIREIIIDSDHKSAIDYRSTLLDQARKTAQEKHHELAITLYAIWIEHFINGILTRAFQRLGYYEDISVPLVKELRLPTKTTALWAIARLPALNQDNLKLMNRIIELRNMFIHYKWQSHDEQVINQQQDQAKEIAQQSEQLISTLLAIESTTFWNGRDTELMEYLREDVKRHWETEPFKIGSQLQDKERLPPADPTGN